MTVKNVSNLAASVQARLQNHARATKRPFQELLQYYAMERFLYRLSKTPHRARFILKGALMLHVWDAPLARATKDLDFLGRLDNSLENLERVIREVCAADVEPDGMVFDPATVKTERIKEDADYEGVRVRFVGLLGKARVAMQIDVGFGDVVTPGAQDITYPALLDFPAPDALGLPARDGGRREVPGDGLPAHAEQPHEGLLRRVAPREAVRLRRRGAREGHRRHVREPRDRDRRRADRVHAGVHRAGVDAGAVDGVPKEGPEHRCPAKLSEVVTFLAEFLLPIARACANGERFNRRWSPGGPWTTGA